MYPPGNQLVDEPEFRKSDLYDQATVSFVSDRGETIKHIVMDVGEL